MSIVNTLSLESNRQIKINFDGGDLSSDAGLLLIKEFVSKLGIDKLFSHAFKTNDSASFRYHTDKENILFEFHCKDTGIGMSKEFQNHIFEPFTQEKGGARSVYGGTGLGMPITKKTNRENGRYD